MSGNSATLVYPVTVNHAIQSVGESHFRGLYAVLVLFTSLWYSLDIESPCPNVRPLPRPIYFDTEGFYRSPHDPEAADVVGDAVVVLATQ